MRTYLKTLVLLLTMLSSSAFAWNHSVELGYGYSHDPNHTKYNNSGVLLSADLFPIKRTPSVFWSGVGSIGQWHTTTPVNKNVTTAALSLALRYYPFCINHIYPAYFLASAGPSYLTSRKFGFNTQASHWTIQTNMGLGAEFHPIDVNLRLQHYSNANLGHPNQGFNILYVLSIGYLFR